MPTGARPTHLLLLLFAAGASSLSAQITNVPPPAPVRDTLRLTEPLGGHQIRQGLWLSGGLGYGSVASRPGGPAMGGVTGGLEAGWTLSRRVLLGIGTSAWTKSGLGETGRVGMTIGSVDLRVRWYPSEMAGGFFFTGAWGLGLIRFSDEQAVPTSYTQTGRALRAGLGYDFRVERGVSITPFGTWSGVRTEDNGDHMAADVWQLGLGLTVH